ncbi:DEAD/DEAH box helicase [Hymenobacter wooponensis]|uniref:DUF2075 domain-containing protein n=1 Tax=Hymenobacter wooponensis TaxID=1525360 RepID=A0A4Z0MPJ8_9BACT|nr:AAA domain-containing protein [Hymenobacter wooponensis]TGD81713.1 DUF2075 domain-containing protein [Hymenobacter wooponensis]
MPASNSPLIDLVEQLRRFHDAEHEAQQREIRQTWALPLAARVRKGSAIANVRIPGTVPSEETRESIRQRLTNAGIEPSEEKILNNFRSYASLSTTVTIEAPVNRSNFRAGSYVLLHRGDPFNERESYPLVLMQDAGQRLTLEAEFGKNPRARGLSDGWVLDAHQPDLRWILHKALDQLLASQPDAINDVLIDHQLPAFDADRLTQAEALSATLGFNARQREAFINAYAARNYYLIQGPPGTGKTWVLAHLATAFARQGLRVLITSSNHRGINNALRKIHEVTSYPHLLKVGKQADADGLGEVANHENGPALEAVDGNGFIVGATCFALYTRRLGGTKFDVVIADEASQLTLLQAAAAMLAGRKYIFIGDHQQMPPIITASHSDPALHRSVFEHLFTRAPGTRLNVTYRLNASLAEFASSYFYENDFTSHESAATRTLHIPSTPTQYADILDPAQPSVFVDLRHSNSKTYERSEAHYVAELVSELLASGVSANEIAVVIPYRAQGRAIRRRLYKRCPDRSPEELAQVTIDTVERMQGQERDVIILSLTSGRFDSALQRASFYFMPNRLNVAITRARVKRIIVGSSRLTRARFDVPELQQWVDCFRDFLNSCHRITRLEPLKKTRPATTSNSKAAG